jgi:O-antigen/teichoic acid export membrane protein
MRAHLANAAYGVLDYAAHPLGMLLAAPMLLKHLGVAQYGVWVVATAVVSTGGVVASGFGDANIQYVASVRSRGDQQALFRAVRSMMGINLLLGFTLATIAWMLAPFLARHVVPEDIVLEGACLWSLRIASLLMLVRAVESVCVSTQRAFERYGAAVRISIVGRLLTLAGAVILTYLGLGVLSIMVATGALLSLGTLAQLIRLRIHLGAVSLLPAFDRSTTLALWSFGAFSWMQAVSGVVFGQADRLVLGVSLGATVVTAYALCVQMAQPIYGLAASGLHFLFPYLAGRQALMPLATLRGAILKAFLVNLLVVAAGTVAVLAFGRPLLHAWVGEAIAQSAGAILTPIAWSFALLGLNVTGCYSLLALGRVREVTWLNLAGGGAMLVLMAVLLSRMGIRGVAMARIVYGLTTLLMYIPLVRLLFAAAQTPLLVPGINPVCEDA